MKYFSRYNLYKASNLTFNPDTCRGYSYDWYRLVDKIGDKVVLNTYSYSNTTIKHIHKTRKLLGELGIKIDLCIEAPEGLQDLNRAIECHTSHVRALEKAMVNGRKAKNEERAKEIEKHLAIISEINQLIQVKGV